jgi:hypothetical protein
VIRVQHPLYNTWNAITTIFHYTDSARLPWILHEQLLKPGRNQIGNFPDPDFLWATTDPLGDSTAASGTRLAKAMYRQGIVAAVRFTLAMGDFMPWAVAKEKHPQWTSQQCARLEKNVPPKQVAQWYCRTEALPASRWLAVEFRTWKNPEWRTVQRDMLHIPQDRSEGLAIRLDDIIYHSQQIIKPGKPTGYAFRTN